MGRRGAATPSTARRAGPLRWRLAGRLASTLPPVRGTDRLLLSVRGGRPVRGPIRGRLTNGLLFDFDDARDAAIGGLIHLQYVEPALAPVLQACLAPGGCFYDIGANIGLYSLWASRIVGPDGCVVAVEPVPVTRTLLERFSRVNGAGNVEIVPYAVGAVPGEVSVDFDAEDSAQSYVTQKTMGTPIRVPMLPLDDLARDLPPPDLVKIDVEGHELRVLEGGTTVWRRDRPMIVVEAIPRHLQRTGTSYADICRFLGDLGYRLFDLTARGLAPSSPDRPTTNVLGLCDDIPSHRRAHAVLAATRFARNQTV